MDDDYDNQWLPPDAIDHVGESNVPWHGNECAIAALPSAAVVGDEDDATPDGDGAEVESSYVAAFVPAGPVELRGGYGAAFDGRDDDAMDRDDSERDGGGANDDAMFNFEELDAFAEWALDYDAPLVCHECANRQRGAALGNGAGGVANTADDQNGIEAIEVVQQDAMWDGGIDDVPDSYAAAMLTCDNASAAAAYSFRLGAWALLRWASTGWAATCRNGSSLLLNGRPFLLIPGTIVTRVGTPTHCSGYYGLTCAYISTRALTRYDNREPEMFALPDSPHIIVHPLYVPWFPCVKLSQVTGKMLTPTSSAATCIRVALRSLDMFHDNNFDNALVMYVDRWLRRTLHGGELF